MNFHIYCETNFTSVSASFPLGCWRVAMGGVVLVLRVLTL